MKQKRKKTVRLYAAILVIILILFQSLYVYAEQEALPAAGFDYMQSIMDMIRDKYKGDISDKELIEGAIKGMFNTMDPYTTFYTLEEAESFMNSINGSYTGIGITMEKSDDYIVVSKVFADSPAEKSGIKQGDIIIAIDGKSIAGIGTDEAASIIMGKGDSAIKISILRGSSTSRLEFNVKLAVIKVNPVTYEIRNNIGYVKIEMFNDNTAEFFAKAFEQFDKYKVTKIILDLRGNPGGEVNQAAEVARYFVPKGMITRLDFNSESLADEIIISNLEKSKYKLVILVNSMSASASEIVAGAVQDTGAGVLVGTKTFGKAKVQNILPVLTREAAEKYSTQLNVKLADGFELYKKYGINAGKDEIAGYTKITTGLYYTPKGRMIDGTGIIPDIVIEDAKEKPAMDVGSIGKLTGSALLKPGSKGYEVLNVEKLLKVLGYEVGTPDLDFDAITAKAIIKFQKTANIKVDGTIGPMTRKALNSVLDKTLLKYDPQYSKALEVLNK